MAWTTPKTNWATGELVTAEDLNAINENLAALKHPAIASYTTTQDIGCFQGRSSLSMLIVTI